MPVFDGLIVQVPIDLIKSKAIPMIILLSDYNQKPISRQISCQLLISLSEVLGKEFKGQILQRAKSLSQDTNSDVRQQMCKSWLAIAKVSTKETIEDVIFIETIKLVQDAVTDVKAEAIELLIQLLQFLTHSFIEAQAFAFIKNEVLVDLPSYAQIKLSQHIGPLLIAIKTMLTKEDRGIVIEVLSHLVDSDRDVRKYIAYNMPGICSALGSCKSIKSLITKLTNDRENDIKVTIASGMHEIVKLDPNCKLLRKISQSLIESPITQICVLKNMQTWQICFSPSELLVKFTGILNASDWRGQLSSLKQIKEIFLQFPMKDIIEVFVPLLIIKMQTSP